MQEFTRKEILNDDDGRQANLIAETTTICIVWHSPIHVPKPLLCMKVKQQQQFVVV